MTNDTRTSYHVEALFGGWLVTEIVIVGAGIGGLGAALLLGRQSRQVIVCERDAALVPRSADEMWSDWCRPGTPQAPLGHGFSGGFRRLLQERAPDVLKQLGEVGAPSMDWGADLPGDERRSEDDDMVGFLSRRAIVEGVLRQAVEAEPTVELRPGCRVTGLVAELPSLDGVPRVVGVRTRDGCKITAESVVVAGGRTLPIQRWLEAIGAPPAAEESEGSGFQYYTRFFQIHPRAGEDPTLAARFAAVTDLRYMLYDFFGADRGTFCIEFGVPIWDHALHDLHEEAIFMAAARALPDGPTSLDPERVTPIGPVAAFGQEHNRLRRFVRDGRPLALGLHVIGDARCTTHNLYGWGVALAFAEAVTMTDLLTELRGDPMAQALAFEERWADEIEGRYRLSLDLDRARRRDYHGEPNWDPDDGGEGFIQTVVSPAAGEDPEIFRALRRRGQQLDPVGALARNTVLLNRARALAAVRPPQAPSVPPGPTRDELIRIVEAARGKG
jgi:2-polyprenyl-6-methoxyphenol hydroxylase-like FAD-dependent oxidoreductase